MQQPHSRSTLPVLFAGAVALGLDSLISLGLHPGFALKFQYERVTPQEGSRGTLINTQGDFLSDRSIELASVALDFVF
jgi:hypothetical protein